MTRSSWRVLICSPFADYPMTSHLDVQSLMNERDCLSQDLDRIRLVVDELLIVCDHLNNDISSLKASLRDARDDATGLFTMLYQGFPLRLSSHMTFLF